MDDAGWRIPEHPCDRAERPGHEKGDIELINPLAIGVTIGGLLLDVIVPRPKPRVGHVPSPLPSVARRPEDTFVDAREKYESSPVASGASS
jgi:hypothetical protein